MIIQTSCERRPDLRDQRRRRATPLTMFLAYLDADHERLGKRYWKTLSERLGVAQVTPLNEWKFEMLSSTALRRIAVEEARQASLVVIATESASILPGGLRVWLESLHAAPAQPGKSWFILLLSESPGYSSRLWPDLAYMEQRAQACGRRLVVYATSPAADGEEGFCLAETREVSLKGLRVVQEFCEAREFEVRG